MKRRIVVGGIMSLAFVAGCAGTSQDRGEVRSPHPVIVHREPVREVIVVERTHVPKGNAYGWWKKHGYREVTVYYDGAHYYGRQYDTGFRAVVVYQREGRYYIADEDAGRNRHHHDDD
jgi:hypothetical protein